MINIDLQYIQIFIAIVGGLFAVIGSLVTAIWYQVRQNQKINSLKTEYDGKISDLKNEIGNIKDYEIKTLKDLIDRNERDAREDLQKIGTQIAALAAEFKTDLGNYEKRSDAKFQDLKDYISKMLVK